jgi:hypothetical protein
MIKSIVIVIVALSMSACTSLSIPSFWDDNESAVITNIRYGIANIDCDEYVYVIRDQIAQVQSHTTWLQLYTESKRSSDIIEIIKPFQASLTDLTAKYKDDNFGPTVDNFGTDLGVGDVGMIKGPSNAYCKIKKKLLTAQASSISRAIMVRF